MTNKEIKEYYKKNGYKLTLDYIRKQQGIGNITVKERAKFYSIITELYLRKSRQKAIRDFNDKRLDGNPRVFKSSSSGGPTKKNFSSTTKKRKRNEKRK
jgi:hypothetical protein